MAGHTSDPDSMPTRDGVFTTSEIDVNQESGTRCAKGLLSQESFQEDITPATVLDYGLELDFLVDYPKLNDVLDQIDWDSYHTSTADVDALNTSDENDPEEKPLEPDVHVSAAQPESDPLLGFPYDFNDEAAATQTAGAQELTSLTCDSVDPTDLLVRAVDDLSDPGDFELPDNPAELEFLESMYLIGSESKPAMTHGTDHNAPALPHSTVDSAIEGGCSTGNHMLLVGSSEPNSKTESRTVLTNPRRPQKGTKRKRYIPNSAYTPLNQAPKNWDIFEYTKDGELDPSRLFSVEEINRLLFDHPLHSGHCNQKESQLKLRVHRTPAASAKRFPNGLQCRFKDCPMRTINQGQVLIIVDELSVQHPNHDPFLNAAYFHLWCIERWCAFEEICKNLNVTAKGRDARWEEGRTNRFRLGGEEEKVVEDWVEACRAHGKHGVGGKPWVTHACPDQRNGCPHYDPPSLAYKGTLCHQLAVTKLHYGGQGRINLRKGREDRAGYEGANITRHLGDLSKEAELREFSRTHRNQNQLKRNPRTGRHYRADGDEIQEEGQSDHRHTENGRQPKHQPPAVVSPYQAHSTKRNRNECDDGQNLDDEIAQAYKKPRQPGPILKTPVWNDHHQDRRRTGTPGISPRTTQNSNSQWTHLEMTTTSPIQDGRFASISGLGSMTPEDESEGEMELAILAAQRRRRLLEIENEKDQEREYRLRRLKLQKVNKKKRNREEGDYEDKYDAESKGKRQRTR